MLGEALSGSGRLLLLSGEPGVGKARLAEELAHEAQARGTHVAWGRCWEEGGAPAYWPWVQIVREAARYLNCGWLAEMGAAAPYIARMITGSVIRRQARAHRRLGNRPRI